MSSEPGSYGLLKSTVLLEPSSIGLVALKVAVGATLLTVTPPPEVYEPLSLSMMRPPTP